MPRGQDVGMVQGGSLSPYVQQSLQAGKQQAENRLLAAAQEAGATTRTKIQEAGATGRTAMQIQSQQRMQAAELEAADRRAAEAERARREDRQYQKMLQDDQQEFLATQSNLEREFTAARQERNFEREDEALRRMEAHQALQDRLDALTAQQRNKVILAIAGMSQRAEEAKQRVITSDVEAAEAASQAEEMGGLMRSQVADAVREDKRLDAPVDAMTPKPAEKIGMAGAGPVYQLPGYVPKVTPMSVLQEHVNRNGSKMDVATWSAEGGQAIARKVADGTLGIADIRGGISTIKGMIEAVEERLDAATTKKDEEFWKRQLNDMKNMQLSVSQLMHDKTKVADNETLTVGSVIRDALDPIEGRGRGNRVARMKDQYASLTKAAEANLQELTRAMNAYEPIPVEAGDDDYLIELIQRKNAARAALAEEFSRGTGGR